MTPAGRAILLELARTGPKPLPEHIAANIPPQAFDAFEGVILHGAAVINSANAGDPAAAKRSAEAMALWFAQLLLHTSHLMPQPPGGG